MRMQLCPCNRFDAKISTSATSLFAFAPPSLVEPFQGYFQYTTTMAMAHTEIPACIDHLNAGTNYDGGSDWNYDVDECNLEGGDYSGKGGEQEFESETFQNPNGTGRSEGD
jgi:hypothetical protein